MIRWRFAVDVGGTFTDCLAEGPDGRVHVLKVASDGRVAGRGRAAGAALEDAARTEVEGFWRGWSAEIAGQRRFVVASRPGHLTLDAPLDATPGPASYALRSGEEAPLVAVRLVTGRALGEPLDDVALHLGTTRGTNALLERRGAHVLFVTTLGFGDALTIGSGQRPALFALTVRRPTPLFAQVLEVDERVTASGEVLCAPDELVVRRALADARAAGAESVAICLVHALAHPDHERLVATLAHEVGFCDVAVSHAHASERWLDRASTACVEAYVRPIVRGYVERIAAALGGGERLELMTSAGGLVAPARFSGTDSVLSGPAGGLLGVAAAARAAGLPRVLAFDMGGTSTDVSRWEGALPRRFSAEIGGAQLAVPTLEIETVAAGGGSIVRFDGARLLVGPESAGSDPGPACYGRGGPLTLTDVNLLSDRLPTGRFPLPLDRAAAEARLDALVAELARAGTAHTRATLCEALRQVGNAQMARALRRVSVERGLDPADHALVAFGAAGGQHACALADELGISRVLVPVHAGALSALGIGLGEVRRVASELVLRDASGGAHLGAVIARVRAAAEAAVRAEGLEPETTDATLHVRARGTEAVLALAADPDTFAKAYVSEHVRRFGAEPEGPLEVLLAAAEAVGRRATPLERALTTPRVRDAGDPHALADGDLVVGPAVVAEPTATVVVEAGWVLRVIPAGLLLERTARPGRSAVTAAADPMSVAVMHHALASVAEQMGAVLERTARSVSVKERLDFSCAVFDAAGALAANAPHVPVHLGAMGETVRAVLADHPGAAEGDAFVTNDPYRGGSHLPDVTVVTPVFRAGRLAAVVACRAHHAEIGGIAPGSMPADGRSLADEGVLLPSLCVQRAGHLDDSAVRARLVAPPHPSRRPDDNLADLRAQLAANAAGVRALEALGARVGWDVLSAHLGHVRAAAAARIRAALLRQPAGTRRFVDHLDDGTPIACAITIDGARATFDFAGTGPVSAGNLNANAAIVTAAVLYCLACLEGGDLPLNGGLLDPVQILVPEGCLLAPRPGPDAAHTPAVVGGNVETSQRVVDVIFGALGLAGASQGTMNNLTLGDGTFGYYETLPGGAGATADGPGADAVQVHMTNTRGTDVEVLERRVPVRVVTQAVRRGSGGAGRHRGGDGLLRILEARAPLEASILSERRGPYRPYGAAGGDAGALGENAVLRAGAAAPEPLGGKARVLLQPGDRLILATPGGGGFGRPDGR